MDLSPLLITEIAHFAMGAGASLLGSYGYEVVKSAAARIDARLRARFRDADEDEAIEAMSAVAVQFPNEAPATDGTQPQLPVDAAAVESDTTRTLAADIVEAVNAEVTGTLKRIESGVDTANTKLDHLIALATADATPQYATFEKTYRRYVANECSRLRLLGVKDPEAKQEMQLDETFVELGIAPLREVPRPLEEGDLDLATLEAMRKGADRGPDVTGDEEKLGEILERRRKLVIVGAPGSGKTTIMRYVAAAAARGSLSELGFNLEQAPVPFLVLVRSLDSDRLPSTEDLVPLCAPGMPIPCPEGFAQDCLQTGRALLLIDGLDEWDQERHDELITWVKGLCDTFGDCRFVVTSRPAGYQAGELRACEFAEAELQPMGEQQIEWFVERWTHAAEKASKRPGWQKEAERRAEDLLQGIRKTPAVRTMASNPLMLAVTCVVHHYRHEGLPERRAQLLKECVDVLLHEWRAAQDLPDHLKGAELDAGQKEALVQLLAWRMMEEGLAETARNTVEATFREVLPQVGADAADAPKWVRYIRDASGVLVEQRPGVLAFAHIVFQELLAAAHAVEEGAYDDLLARAGEDDWLQVIPLAAGLNARGCDTMVRALLDRDHVLAAGRCVATATRLPEELRARTVARLLVHPSPLASFELRAIGGTFVLDRCLQAILEPAPDPPKEGVPAGLVSVEVVEADRDALAAGAESAIATIHKYAGTTYFMNAVMSAFSRALIAADEAVSDPALEVGTLRTALQLAYPATGRYVGRTGAEKPLDGHAVHARAAEVLAELASEDVLPKLLDLASSTDSDCEQRLWLWCPLANLLEVEHFDMAAQAMAELGGTEGHFVRLAVMIRLRHQWRGLMTAQQENDWDLLIGQAEDAVRKGFRAVFAFATIEDAERPDAEAGDGHVPAGA